MKVRGELSGKDDLTVDGEIEGTVHMASARVTVRTEGLVRATVMAHEVIVMGRIEGEIRATGRVELRSGAVVVGDIFATRLSMEDGAMLRGHVDPERATEPLPATEAEPSLFSEASIT
jgi:cytoskeletal protein CcmA (bactofilin family)